MYDIKNISYIPLNNIGSLPKGTIDCATSTIIVDNKKYYNLSSGLRVKEQDLEVIKENNNIENNISKIEITEDEKYVSVKVKESEKASYILKVNGIDYDNKNTSNYGVKNINFDNISIEFNNSILITDKIKFNNNEIFKDAELVKGEKPTLKLSFKNKDGYYGHLANYDDEGNLIIKFRKKVKSIKDLKVVIDSGHGLIENGINDPGALGFNNINEHDINVKIAEQVKNELVEKGATVVILDTSNKFYSLGERPEEAAKMDADLFISIHNNSGGSGEFNANEVYYNKPFSKALALQINKEILSVYKNDLFGGNEDKYNRGTKWDYYTVILEEHCPSVLVEVGYVDNEVSFNKLIDPLYQEKLGKAIASGIEKYININ
ncbi:N-acetylmuramoyl-L-alanine amidase [Clostridium chauvoei]|nr:N-acetylmuramoyl-L-alanine amidase [Clostridium chauvoei]